MRVLTPAGVVFTDALTPRQRQLVALHWNAVRRYLEYGDDSALVDLERAYAAPGGDLIVGEVALTFDLDVIEYVAFRGDVRFESIYDEVV